MNIIELIPDLKTIEKAEALMKAVALGIYFDTIDLYLKDKLALDSEIIFLDAETTPGTNIITIDDVEYKNLFPLYMAQEMVEAYVANHPELKDTEIAQRLLDYTINDA